MDWHSFIFAPEKAWPMRLDELARRRFRDETLAEEAYNYAFDEISRDDWRRLREHYQGRATPDGFLLSVFNNLLADFARRRFGRPRPPAWVKRNGPLWVEVFGLLCLQRQDPNAIINVLADAASEADVRHMIREIKARHPHCGEGCHEVSTEEEHLQIFDACLGVHDSPERERCAAEVQDAKTFLALLLESAESPGESEASAQLRARLPETARAAELTDTELTLLRLIYVHKDKVSVAARRLGLAEHTARRMEKRSVARLQQVLAEAGICVETVAEQLRAMA